MNKVKWLNIVKITQAIGITILGIFFIFDLNVFILFLGGFVSIFSTLSEWVLTFLIQKKHIRPIPLIASFLKVVVILAIVFRGIFQNTDLSLVSFIVLVIAVSLALIFQLIMMFDGKKKKDVNTLDN